jgi:REP element-mobilizing transposase RayT
LFIAAETAPTVVSNPNGGYLMEQDFRSPRSRDLRKGRYAQPGGIYRLTAVTDGRVPHFADWLIGRLLVGEFRRLHEAGLCDSLAYVVMPDHFHWLVSLNGQTSLSQLVRLMKGRSARQVNQGIGGQGRVWQAGFHDHALRKDEDLQAVARYIVANPLRAGLVTRLGDYPLWDAVWL